MQFISLSPYLEYCLCDAANPREILDTWLVTIHNISGYNAYIYIYDLISRINYIHNYLHWDAEIAIRGQMIGEYFLLLPQIKESQPSQRDKFGNNTGKSIMTL